MDDMKQELAQTEMMMITKDMSSLSVTNYKI